MGSSDLNATLFLIQLSYKVFILMLTPEGIFSSIIFDQWYNDNNK